MLYPLSYRRAVGGKPLDSRQWRTVRLIVGRRVALRMPAPYPRYVQTAKPASRRIAADASELLRTPIATRGVPYLSAACAAASRAMGTRNGEQLT